MTAQAENFDEFESTAIIADDQAASPPGEKPGYI